MTSRSIAVSQPCAIRPSPTLLAGPRRRSQSRRTLRERAAGTLAEVERDDLTAAAVRGAILDCGALLVRGLLAEHVERLVAGIDTAFAAKAKASDGE